MKRVRCHGGISISTFGTLKPPSHFTKGWVASEDGGLVRIGLASQNLGEDYERLAARDVPFLSAPQVCQRGMAEIAICLDPDDSMIELIQVRIENWAVPTTLGTDA